MQPQHVIRHRPGWFLVLYELQSTGDIDECLVRISQVDILANASPSCSLTPGYFLVIHELESRGDIDECLVRISQVEFILANAIPTCNWTPAILDKIVWQNVFCFPFYNMCTLYKIFGTLFPPPSYINVAIFDKILVQKKSFAANNIDLGGRGIE